MITLDETTGLPQLPEGQFWRVRSANSDNPNLAVVMLMATQTVHGTVRKWWWNVPTTTVTEKWLESAYVREWYKENGAVAWEENNVPADVPTNFDKTTRMDGLYSYYDVSVTKETILRTAIKILEKRAEQAEKTKFFGDYPPKSLNTDSVAV